MQDPRVTSWEMSGEGTPACRSVAEEHHRAPTYTGAHDAGVCSP